MVVPRFSTVDGPVARGVFHVSGTGWEGRYIWSGIAVMQWRVRWLGFEDLVIGAPPDGPRQ